MSASNPFPRRTQDGEEWISVSDLMAGLMIVFLAIAVFFMVQLKGPVDEWIRTRERLSLALKEEFQDSLSSWNAEIIESTLTIRIPTPEVLFPTGSATLRPRFQEILDDFFPRFVAVLMQEEFRDHIPEVRIEGHTSSFWEGEQDPLRKYENNMRLSQDRSRAVLSYVSRLDALRIESVWDAWLRQRLTANGLSSSQVILRPDSTEDQAHSQRVDFRVRTDAAERMFELRQRTAARERE